MKLLERKVSLPSIVTKGIMSASASWRGQQPSREELEVSD